MQVVEIGKGSKVKYELDKETGLIKVMAVSWPLPILNCTHVFMAYVLLNMHKCTG